MDINNWKYAFDSHGREGVMVERTYELDSKKPTKFVISPDFLQYTKCAVEIICVGAIGTSGSVKIHETNLNISSDSQKYDTGLIVALGVNSNNYTPIPIMYLSHLALEFPGTVGTAGKLIVRLVGKE